MKKTLLTALIAAVIVIPIALGGSYFYFKSNSTKKQTADNDAIVQKSSLQKELEKKLKSEGKFLLQLPAPKLTETQTGQSQWISFTTLESHELYLKDPKNPDNYLFLDSQGNLKENGKTIHKMVLHAELLHSAGKKWLFVDNMTLNTDMSNWQLFWASREKREPQVKLESYTAHKMADSFMRTELLEPQAAWRRAAHDRRGFAELQFSACRQSLQCTGIKSWDLKLWR